MFRKALIMILVGIMLLFAPAIAQSAEYACTVDKKFSYEHEYTSSEIKKWQFSLTIEEKGSTGRGDIAYGKCKFVAP